MDESGLRLGSGIVIPLREIDVAFARSGGPGGQNVNKVASKVVLRFDVRHSASIPEPARRRALAALASRLTTRGELVVSASATRDQSRNRHAALERLRALLATAIRRPRHRVPTQPSPAARERRLTAKKVRGKLKRQRAIRE